MVKTVQQQLKEATIDPNEKVSRAVKKVKTGLSFAISGGTYEGITWSAGVTDPPTKAEVEAKYSEVEAEWNAQKYYDVRSVSYPDIGDQLDDLYKQGAFSADMAAKIKKVKDDNPKS